MIDAYRLGAWDLEKVIDGKGYFLQPKVYYERVQDGANTVKFKGVSRETQKNFTESFYEGLYKVLCAGDEKKCIVETDKPLLRSVFYLQKTGKDLNTLEFRDKGLNMRSMQKRIVDYEGNSTKPYYFDTLDEFRQFRFVMDLSKLMDENGCILNVRR